MDPGQILLIVLIVFVAVMWFGRREARRSGRLDAYHAERAARRGIAAPAGHSAAIASPAITATLEPEPEEDWAGARRVGSDIQVRANSPAEIKIAIKELRLMKKEIQANRRELSGLKSEENAAWRERQAGRLYTRGLGRGTTGKILGAGVAASRRGERMGHADRVNKVTAAQTALDRQIISIDRLIAQCEAELVRGEKSGS